MLKKIFQLLLVLLVAASFSSCKSKQPTSVVLDKTEITVTTGESFELTAKVLPEKASQEVSWQRQQWDEIVYSSNITEKASHREFKAMKYGEMSIKVVTDNGLEAVCYVTVNMNQEEKDSLAKELLDKGDAIIAPYEYDEGESVNWNGFEDAINNCIDIYEQIPEDTSSYSAAQQRIKRAKEWFKMEKEVVAYNAKLEKELAAAKLAKQADFYFDSCKIVRYNKGAVNDYVELKFVNNTKIRILGYHYQIVAYDSNGKQMHKELYDPYYAGYTLNSDNRITIVEHLTPFAEATKMTITLVKVITMEGEKSRQIDIGTSYDVTTVVKRDTKL